MSSKVAKLASAYRQHLSVPWQPGLAAIQRVIFAVYDKADELRLRANVGEFELLTHSKLARTGFCWISPTHFRSGWLRRSIATRTSSRRKTSPATKPVS